MPLRLMKTILNELVKLKGPTITQHMSLVPLDNNPTIISYAPSQCLCVCYVLLCSTTRRTAIPSLGMSTCCWTTVHPLAHTRGAPAALPTRLEAT